MYKEDLIEYYGSQANIARALGITRQAVNLWDTIVPEGIAYKVESLTEQELKVDPRLYQPDKR